MGREVIMQVVTGVKRIGKTHKTLDFLVNEYSKMNAYRNGRKVLIFDPNNEFGSYNMAGTIVNIKKIGKEYIELFGSTAYKTIEVRRIIPFKKDMSRMDDNEIEELLIYCMERFRGGCFFIDDLSTIFGDSLPKKFASRLCNNAHRDCDIIFHLQSIARMLPKFLQNTNIVRFHHQIDSVSMSKEKLKEQYEMFDIAQKIVDYQFDSGNIRYFLYVDKDANKIRGDRYFPLQKQDAIRAVEEHLYRTKNQIGIAEARLRASGYKGKDLSKEAFNHAREFLLAKYFSFTK